MKDQKDIIEEIVNRLRNVEEMPYREGAWESFRDQRLQGVAPEGSRVTKLYYWWSAAAAVLVFAIAGWWFIQDDAQLGDTISMHPNTEVPQKIERPNVIDDTDVPVSEQPHDPRSQNTEEEVVSLPLAETAIANIQQALPFEVITERGIANQGIYESQAMAQPPAFEFRHPSLTYLEPNKSIDVAYPTILANTNISQHTLGKEVEEKNRHFKLTDRFSLGLVVAPSSTSQRMSFGGGLLFSYQIGKNLSVRTGATFHQYEANMLKDPLQSDFVEVAKTQEPTSSQDLYAGASMSARQAYIPMIPNVNAVSGFVQTVDIPLEVKYTVYKGFYANTGVSYAAVVNQKRYAHYIENVNSSPFVKGLPSTEEEVQSSVTPVTRMMESENDNVRTSGFGGFVNMSVGKEVKVSPKMSLSVEPFVKIPVGNFKHADMNYRNGGVRIITNF